MNIQDQLPFPKNVGVITQSRTGSSYTCDPPVNDTDVDYLVLVQYLWDAILVLKDTGWILCEGKEGAYEDDNDYSITWYAVRRQNLNLILTADPGWYQRAVQATTICKRHNILDKDDRIIVFRWIRDGGDAEVDAIAYNDALKRWPL